MSFSSLHSDETVDIFRVTVEPKGSANIADLCSRLCPSAVCASVLPAANDAEKDGAAPLHLVRAPFNLAPSQSSAASRSMEVGDSHEENQNCTCIDSDDSRFPFPLCTSYVASVLLKQGVAVAEEKSHENCSLAYQIEVRNKSPNEPHSIYVVCYKDSKMSFPGDSSLILFRAEDEEWTRFAKEDIQVHERILNVPSASIAEVLVAPAHLTALHSLTSRERYLLMEGIGCVEVGCSKRAVAAGDVVDILEGTGQRILNTGDANLRFYCICSPCFQYECYTHMEDPRLLTLEEAAEFQKSTL